MKRQDARPVTRCMDDLDTHDSRGSAMQCVIGLPLGSFIDANDSLNLNRYSHELDPEHLW